MSILTSIKTRISSQKKEAIKNILRDLVYFSWKIFSPYKREINPQEIKRVLIINCGVIGLGDLIVITPMIKALAKKYKSVDILMKKGMEDILSGNPNISNLIFYTNFQDILFRIKGKYQLAVIYSPYSYEIKKLCMQAGIEYTVGNSFSYSWSDIFLSQRTHENPYEHFVQKALDEARLAHADIKNPKIELYFSEKDKHYVDKLLKSNKINNFVVVHAGKGGNASDPRIKRFFWPTKRFAQVIDYITKEYKLSVVLTGSSIEQERNDEIMSLVKSKNVFNFCKKTSLKQWMCLIKKSKLLLSLNTGATHIAPAFNTKTIVINEEFPELWHPWMSKNRYKMLAYPSVEQVKKGIDELLV
jgi:ADP-heptose:LPS heptosyltransferase